MENVNDLLKWIPVHEHTEDGEPMMLKSDVKKALEGYFELQKIALKLEIGKIVYHNEVYSNEPLKVIGIRETQVELEGDFSGGTHPVWQQSWMPIRGVIFPIDVEVSTSSPLMDEQCGKGAKYSIEHLYWRTSYK